MKIYEVTGKIRENPQQPGMQQAKVVKQAGNELTVAPQAQGQPTGTEVTVDLSKNPQAIQKDPQGNITVDPNAQPNPTGGMQLQPGQDINIAGGAPGAMLPNQKPGQPPQPGQQDQVTPENMDDTEVADMKKLAGIKEQPANASQIPTSLTVAGMLDDPEVDPAMKPQLQQMIVAKPDGTVDLEKSMRKVGGEFYSVIPELIEVFQSLAQQAAAFVKSPQFSELGPQDQNSIIDLAKTLPTSIQQMQATVAKGAQAHDAAFNKMDAATGQYGDGTVEDAQAEIPMDDSYYPTGYNDKYREKAMMRKAFQSVTQDDQYFEGNQIVALAKRVANVPSKAPNNQKKDIVDLKKLAGL